MSAITNYLETRVINFWLRNTTYTPPAAVFLALFTTPTTDAGGGVEVVGGSYARQGITLVVPTDGLTFNSNLIQFPLLPACTVVAGAIFDAVSTGNMLIHGTFSASRPVAAGKDFVVGIGEVTFRIR